MMVMVMYPRQPFEGIYTTVRQPVQSTDYQTSSYHALDLQGNVVCRKMETAGYVKQLIV